MQCNGLGCHTVEGNNVTLSSSTFLTFSLSLICSLFLKSGSPRIDSRPPTTTDPLSLGCKEMGVTNTAASLWQHT